jgi:hypothetical protein
VKLTFVDELPASKKRGRVNQSSQLAEKLKAKPMTWARYPAKLTKSTAYQYASAINVGKGGTNPLHSGEYRAAVREGVLYLRYIGASDTSFEEWMEEVNAVLMRKYGIGVSDLADAGFRDGYENEYTPEQMAIEVLENDDIGVHLLQIDSH